MIGLCVLTSAIGISLCFHRSLTHRGLRIWKPLEYFMAFLGTLSLQGGPITWVATHRQHHAATDRDGDPHGTDKGFFWAHCEWLLKKNSAVPDEAGKVRLAPDLTSDPIYRFLDRNNVQFQLLLALALYVWGGWSFVVWGVFVRLVLIYHSTWLVNSAAHMFGYRRPYKTNDFSRNNWWVAHPLVGRRLAQQPPRVSVLGAPRAGLVRIRPHLAHDPRPASRRLGPRRKGSHAENARAHASASVTGQER